MPLKIVRASDNAGLWSRCVSSFLEGAAGPGPSGHADWIWFSHRSLRDRLLEAAHAFGHEGWLDPPITFFGELAKLFEVRERPVGLLTRRRILARAASRLGRDILSGAAPEARGIVRSHVLDALLGDLLPEGIGPDELAVALAGLPGDEFSRARNEWIVATCDAYLTELARLGRPDWRQINALLAARIEDGELPRALRGAERLHVYGITSPRTRCRLLTALAEQPDVEVRLYLLRTPEFDPFFAEIADEIVDVDVDGNAVADADAEAARTPEDAPASPATRVQPVPDAAREVEWIAREIKQLVANGEAEPHEVAVVARSGREDTRRVFRALGRAGVPATARIRTPLAEIPALKALLLVFCGAARDWDYRSLRAVLDHPCFHTRVDLRGIDFIAAGRRVTGLAAWREKLEHVKRLVEEDARETWGESLYDDRLEKDVAALDAVRERLDPLGESRTEAEWIDLTRRLLKEDQGLFRFRRRVCDPVFDRWDIVRLDQRGIIQLERLLDEWRELDPHDEPCTPEGWYALLRRLLEANELVLSTPAQKGVQVLEAHDAGLVPFAHTYVMHANDGEFPRTPSTSAVLSNEERRRLRARGLPVDQREVALRRERELWRAITNQGMEAERTASVTVTYRTTNPNGTPLLPSLMVPAHDPATELPRQRRPAGQVPVTPEDADAEAAFTLAATLGAAGGDEGYVPGPSENAFEEAPGDAQRNAASGKHVADATDDADAAADGADGPQVTLDLGPAPGDAPGNAPGDAPGDSENRFTDGPGDTPAGAADAGARTVPRLRLGPAHPALLRQAIVAAVAESHRGAGLARSADPEPHPALRPNPWNGKLRDPEVLRRLREKFDEAHAWSASQLESYARIPFQFLLQRVLRVDPKEEAEEETSPLAFGSVAHEILEKFYTEFCDPLPPALTAECRERLDEIADAVFTGREEAGDWLGLPALWETSRESMRQAVREFIEWDLALLHKHGERPYRMEHQFGYDGELLELRSTDIRGEEAMIRLRGKIDRVDATGAPDAPTLHVLDYKSGYVPSAPDYDDGTILQGVLYLEALADEGHRVGIGRYRSIRKRGTQNAAKVSYGSDRYATALALAMTIPARVRAGLFEPVVSRRSGWKDWDAPLEIRRTHAQVADGHRFDPDELDEPAPRPDADRDADADDAAAGDADAGGTGGTAGEASP